MTKAAAFFETRRFAAYKGATTEFSKWEGVQMQQTLPWNATPGAKNTWRSGCIAQRGSQQCNNSRHRLPACLPSIGRRPPQAELLQCAGRAPFPLE